MSQSDSITKEAGKKIALLSSSGSLQTGLLAKLISDELQLDCLTITALPSNIEQFSLILLDCSSEDLNSLTAVVKTLNSQEEPLEVALLNVSYDSEYEGLLDWPCVSGLFYIDTQQEQLIRGLECLLDGEYWMPRKLLHHFLDKNRKSPTEFTQPDVKLTRREREILRLIRDGATNAHISNALEVSEHTVKSHLYNVYKKIGVRNRLEASNWVRNLDEIEVI